MIWCRVYLLYLSYDECLTSLMIVSSTTKLTSSNITSFPVISNLHCMLEEWQALLLSIIMSWMSSLAPCSSWCNWMCKWMELLLQLTVDLRIPSSRPSISKINSMNLAVNRAQIGENTEFYLWNLFIFRYSLGFMKLSSFPEDQTFPPAFHKCVFLLLLKMQ